MSIVLKRPMFRKGGSVAEGTGITSGLTNRKRFADGSDNPMGDYVNTDDNDLYTNAQNADFSSDDIDREKAKEILKDIISKNVENEKSYTFDNSNISDNKETANDWMDYLSSSGETPIVTTEPKTRSTIGTANAAEKTNVGDDYSQLGIGYETTPEDVKKAINEINKAKTIQGTQAQVSNKPVITTDKKATPATVTDESVSFADAHPIYNAQGQNITQSIINASQVLKSQMTPSDSDNFMSFIRKFGSTAKGPLDLQTLGSALGETAEKVDVAKQKSDLELNKYLGTIMGRTIGTLGKAGTQTSIKTLTGNPKVAFENAVMGTGINPKSIEEAISNPIFMEAWRNEKEKLGIITPQQKFDAAQAKTDIKTYQSDYGITEDESKYLWKMLHDGSAKSGEYDPKKPIISGSDLKERNNRIKRDANGNLNVIANVQAFDNKYTVGKKYAVPGEQKWYIYRKDAKGVPYFELVK